MFLERAKLLTIDKQGKMEIKPEDKTNTVVLGCDRSNPHEENADNIRTLKDIEIEK